MAFRLGEAYVEFKERGLAGVVRSGGAAVSSLRRVAGVATIVGGVLTGVLGSKLAGAINRSAQEIDLLAKTADKLGITTEELAGLRHAASLTGVEMRQFDNGLQRMVRNISTAATGFGEAQKALSELGLDAAALNQQSPDEQFRQIADAMKGIDNQSDRVRLTFQLFGREGVNLVNTLKLGASGLRQATEEAQRLGIAVSREDAAAVENYNDAIERLSQSWTGFTRDLTVTVAPGLQVMADVLKELTVATRNWDESLSDLARGAIVPIGELMAAAATGNIQEIRAAIGRVAGFAALDFGINRALGGGAGGGGPGGGDNDIFNQDRFRSKSLSFDKLQGSLIRGVFDQQENLQQQANKELAAINEGIQAVNQDGVKVRGIEVALG